MIRKNYRVLEYQERAAAGSVLYYCHRTRDVPVHVREGGWFHTRITDCINGQLCVFSSAKSLSMLKGTLPEIQNVTKENCFL